jgi:hypothetical protein
LTGFQVETVANAVSQAQALWDYWSSEWLSMRARTVKNVSRRPLTRFWKQVQAVDLTQKGQVAELEPVWFSHPQYSDEKVIAQIKSALKKSQRYGGSGSALHVLESLLPRLLDKLE